MKCGMSRGLRKCCLSVGMGLVRLIGYQFCGRRDSAPLRCTMPRCSAVASLPHAGSSNGDQTPSSCIHHVSGNRRACNWSLLQGLPCLVKTRQCLASTTTMLCIDRLTSRRQIQQTIISQNRTIITGEGCDQSEDSAGPSRADTAASHLPSTHARCTGRMSV